MTSTLSSCITRGATTSLRFPAGSVYNRCPLGAAYVGSLPSTEVEPFWAFMSALSVDSLCRFMHKNLMRVFPQLGQSVRSWPRLANMLETPPLKMIPAFAPPPRRYPNRKQDAGHYSRVAHCSLWRAITGLYDAGYSRTQVAVLLVEHGL